MNQNTGNCQKTTTSADDNPKNQFYFVLVHAHHLKLLTICQYLAVCCIAKNNYNIPVILHLLDDFWIIQTADSSGDRTMAILTMIFKNFNIPLSTKKTVGLDTTLEYLGVILDTANMESRLPPNKVDRIISFIGTFLSRRSIRKQELLQLLGHFNFAARVIIPGRSFVTYLINLFTKVNNLNYYVSLSPECREDLKMWQYGSL